MPVETMNDDARASEGINRLELSATKGDKIRIVPLYDSNIKARRHFIQIPEDDKATVVACELDYGNNCLACDNAVYAKYPLKSPVAEAQWRYAIPCIVMDQASKTSGRPLALAVKDGKYIGEYTLTYWEFGWAKDWNKIIDFGLDRDGASGVEIVVEVTNPSNKQVDMDAPHTLFLPDGVVAEYVTEFEETFGTQAESEPKLLCPRLPFDELKELIANSGIESSEDDTEDDTEAENVWGNKPE